MKAQYWSIDMIFSIVVFTSALIILATVWGKVNSDFSIAYGFGIGNMQAQLQSLQQRILEPGSPANWASTVNALNTNTWDNVSIGLGNGNTSTISSSKLMMLMAMSNSNYQATKQSMGVGYDYYITIYSPGNYNISVGENPLQRNATAIQSAVVPVILDNGAVGTMTILVWTNTTFGVS
jgi:hypothetical protein